MAQDMTPDEMERFEDEVIRDADPADEDWSPASESAIAKETTIDRDSDGLPDSTIGYRTPS